MGETVRTIPLNIFSRRNPGNTFCHPESVRRLTFVAIIPAFSFATSPAITHTSTPIQSAQRTIRLELQAIEALLARINGDFTRACDLILACKGRVVVVGMGKSGHIGRKIAATLASTGTTAYFVHPGEASHGDMGMITRDDVVLALS